jgi:DNA-binding protein H-NS
MNKKLDLDAMSVDEKWKLHEEIVRILRELEKRLGRVRHENEMPQSVSSNNKLKRDASGERRKYPRVLPKYRNSIEPFETWSWRGRQPRWLIAALRAGHTIDEFVMSNWN